MLLEALNIRSQVLVFLSELGVEVLLEVQVTLHVVNLAIPEVELVPLLAIILLHQGDTASDITLLSIFLLEIVLERLNSTLKSLLVSIESGA